MGKSRYGRPRCTPGFAGCAFVHHAEVSRRNEPLLSIIINEIAHVEVIQIWDTDPFKIPIQMPLHKPILGPFALSDLVPYLNSMAFFLRPMIST